MVRYYIYFSYGFFLYSFSHNIAKPQVILRCERGDVSWSQLVETSYTYDISSEPFNILGNVENTLPVKIYFLIFYFNVDLYSTLINARVLNTGHIIQHIYQKLFVEIDCSTCYRIWEYFVHHIEIHIKFLTYEAAELPIKLVMKSVFSIYETLYINNTL